MGHENSGVGDPSDESERFQPRHPAPNPGHPPHAGTPGAAAQTGRQSWRATRCTHRPQRQAGRRISSGRALAGGEVTDSRGEGAEVEQYLTRARLVSQCAQREPKYSVRPCLRREGSTQG